MHSLLSGKCSMIRIMQTDNSTSALHNKFQLLILILLTVFMFFVLRSTANSQTDFYNNLWAPTRMLVQGDSPYDTTPLKPELPALWFPMAVGLFSFLGFFEFETAQQIWFLLNIFGLAGLLYFCFSDWRSIPILLTSTLLAYFFPPVIQHLVLGQISIVLALSLLIATRLAATQPWLSAFFLALGMAKPQIGFLVLFGLSLHQYWLGGFQRVIRYGVQTFLAALVLCLPLFIAQPNWISDWLASLQANTFEWTHPSTLSQLKRWLGIWGYFPWGLVLLSVIWVTVKIWRNLLAHHAAMWTLALTVLVTPYVWSWDFVLLLPIFVYVLSSSKWWVVIVLCAGYGLIWAGMAIIQLSSDFHNSRFWWVPLSFIGLLVLVISLDLKTRKETLIDHNQ